MPLGEILPQDPQPYVSVMAIGFMLGVVGHLVRSRWLVAIGIALVFVSTVLLPLAAGPVDRPGA
jgi:hypothetical protein